MLIYLGVGTFIAFLVARLAIRSVEDAILGGIADSDVAGLARAVLDATLADLRGVTVIVLIVAAIVAIAAYVRGRPTWVTKTASSVGGAATAAPPIATPSRRPSTRTAPRSSGSVVGAIAFIVAWLALGLEIALLGAALVIGFEVVLRALADDPAPVAEPPRRGPGRARQPAGRERVAAVRPWTGDLELLDPDGRGLEFGRAGLRVRGVDRQQVDGDLVLEVHRHEREPRPQRLVDPDRRLDLAASRDDAHPLALGQPVRRGILRARCRATRRVAAATCSRPSGRPCCTSRAAGRS